MKLLGLTYASNLLASTARLPRCVTITPPPSCIPYLPILYSCAMQVYSNIMLCLFFLFIILYYRYYFYFNGRGIQYYYNDRLRAHTRAQNKPLWM